MLTATTLAIIWLCLLLVVAVVYAINLARQSDYNAWESTLYLPAYVLGRLLWRVHFTNAPPPELQRGAILVANHRSSLDPFFVQLAAKRRVHWMVAKEYCTHFLFGPLLKLLQVIPTNRSGSDTASTRMAMKITKRGRLVGMFPEGRLNHTEDPLVSIRSGAAMVAIKSEVPIVPIFIHGSPYRRTVWSPIVMPARVAITFGDAIFDPASVGEDGGTGSEEITETANAEILESEQQGSVPASPKSSPPEDGKSDRKILRERADSMMLQWGRQIVEMAGMPDFPVCLAGARHAKR